MGLKQRFSGIHGGKVLESTNLLVYTLVVIGIVVVINWFVNQHNRRWDLTPTQKYSLSPQSKKILKELNRKVDIYVFDRSRNFRERQDLLQNYKVGSHFVNVDYIDPDRQPSLARQFGVRTYGTIVVASGDRHFDAQGATEQDITNALIRVLKGQKTVYFVEGHGERDPASSDRGGYSRMKKELENENYEVKSLLLLQKMQIPADCAMLIVAGPRTDYLPQEVDAIQKYIENGGRAIFMLDPTSNLPNLSNLLDGWNVTVQDDLVIDLNPVAQIFGTEPTMPLIIKYGSSPIVQPLARVATLFPVTRSFSISNEAKAGAVVNSLCQTSTDSYGVADFNPKVQTVTVKYRPGKDFKGPLTVAVSGTLSEGGGNKTEGRFIALGTSALADNTYVGFQGNTDLFMNMVNWLTAEEDLISIRAKPPESQHLNLTVNQMRQILFLGVFGLPILIIIVGASVWWSRR